MEDFAEKLTNPEFTGNADHWDLLGFTYNSNNIKIVDPTLGVEKIVNGTLDTNADNWTLQTGWTYSGTDHALRLYSYSSNKSASQEIVDMVTPMVNGETYRLTFDIPYSWNGALKVTCGGKTLVTSVSGVGSYSYDFVCSNSTLPLKFLSTSATDFIFIDNISLKKLLPNSVSQPIIEMVSPLTVGNKEEITIVISGYVKGNVVVTCGGVTIATLSSNGTHVNNFLVTDDTKPVIISSSVATELVIESVSLKRYASKIKVYVDGSFQLKPIKIYKTDAFINCVVRKFNGVDFEDA